MRSPVSRNTRARRWRGGVLAIGLAVAVVILLILIGGLVTPIPVSMWLQHPHDALQLAQGKNPHPVKLIKPPVRPLSAMARLGRSLFYDRRLSGSGRMSCATCHDPRHAYGPPGRQAVMLGGPDRKQTGFRAVPSLRYLYRQPPFSIGPDVEGDADRQKTLRQQARAAGRQPRLRKTAANPAVASRNRVPQGGLFWDGRANTLQQQAAGPLFNPVEMAAGSPRIVAEKIRHSRLAGRFRLLFGQGVFANPDQVVSEALFAIARYQIEDPSFHPFSSKYDAWLQGKARFTQAELRGYLAFNDPDRGNCAACHRDRPSPGGLPPLLTDHQYEALGVPRNRDIPANHDPGFHDLGLCGPFRTDLASQLRYCGLFLTPTLRNVAIRKVFFHNGVYHSLKAVLKFYDFRDTRPETIYPVDADGRVVKYNDLPAADRQNVDTIDAPFDRQRGERPAMSAQDRKDIIAFLKTLTDGYRSR